MSKQDWTDKLREQLADYQVSASRDLWADIERSLALGEASNASDSSDSPNHATISDAFPSSSSASTRILSLKRWSAAAAVALLAVGGSYVYLRYSSDTEMQTACSLKGIIAADHPQSAASSEGETSSSSACAKGKATYGNRVVAVANPLSARIMAAVAGVPVEGIDDSVATGLAAESEEAETYHRSEEDTRATANSRSAGGGLAASSQPALGGRDDYAALAYSKPQGRGITANVFAENVFGNGGNAATSGPMVLSAPMAMMENCEALSAAVSMQRAAKYVDAKHHAPLSVGAQVGVDVVPRLSLSTGVVYTRVASDFQSYGMLGSDASQVLHYIGVPLSANYEVWRRGGFHAYVMAGGEADFNVKNVTEESGEKLEHAKRDRVQFSVRASLGAQYDLAPQVGIYVEPGARYYFDNGSDVENTFKDKKLNFNLQFGLRVNLK